jgi:hypothetical protein
LVFWKVMLYRRSCWSGGWRIEKGGLEGLESFWDVSSSVLPTSGPIKILINPLRRLCHVASHNYWWGCGINIEEKHRNRKYVVAITWLWVTALSPPKSLFLSLGFEHL